MVRVKNFNEGLEESLIKLGQEVEKQKTVPEIRDLPEREIVKSSIKSMAAQAVVQESPPIQKVIPASGFLPPYIQSGDVAPEIEAEIKDLVKTALNENLEKAFVRAKKYPPFIEDAFHDALTGELLPELKKRGII